MESERLAKAFGEVVRRLRHERGLSQEDFAFHAGLHRTYMGAIERGEKLVSILTAFKIANGLGIPVEDLFAEVNHDLPLPDRTRKE